MKVGEVVKHLDQAAAHRGSESHVFDYQLVTEDGVPVEDLLVDDTNRRVIVVTP